MKKLVLPLLLAAAPAAAQDMDHMPMPAHGLADMDMSGHAMPVPQMEGLLGRYAMSREASGTSWQPDAAPHNALHLPDTGDWMVMVHGRALGVMDSQSGPRGDSSVFSSSMLMAMASTDTGSGGTLGLKAMLSLDPLTGRRGYPLLLASGETADGVTHLLDRQHPHDLFMELSASYSRKLSDGDSLFVYAGYPGEPALGPSAYMHRVSAMDNPMTPLSHHWLDSTHVTFGVLTAGLVHEDWKLEVSQFTGREPDQHRFDFDGARFDSTAVRLSFNPGPNWSLQVSAGWLKSPEGFDTFDFGTLAATLALGNKHLSDGTDESAVLLEGAYKPDDAWTLFARAETFTSDELVPEPGVKRAGEASAGLIHDWRLGKHGKLGLGGLYAFDVAPASVSAPYGGGPHGAMAFVRLVLE
jgi:hypothetical protein